MKPGCRYSTSCIPFTRLMGLAAAWLLAMAGVAWTAAPTAAAPGARSHWVALDEGGRLAYTALPAGDRIIDFSQAGYMGGGVSLPEVPVKKTVAPSGGDDTAAIQGALDEVARLEPVNGFRGAVLLAPGAFNCGETLKIGASGVVLRGSGSGAGGTTINMTGKPHLCLSIQGPRSAIQTVGMAAAITDAYLPAGATELSVADAAGFKPGDAVLIRRPVTTAWGRFMGMDHLVRDGKPEHWLSPGGSISFERVITKVEGHKLTLDLALTDSFDAKYLTPPGGSVIRCAGDGRVRQVGVERLHLVSPPQAVTIAERHHQALRISGACDAWAQDLTIDDTVNSVGISGGARRVTVERVVINHRVATLGAAKPADFSANGTQLLFDRCSGQGDNIFYFATGGGVTGPIVLLNCTFHGNGHIQPHMRWATGLLVDGCQVPEGGIDFMNRGEMGSGHGWTTGWSVAWNCLAKSYVIQNPPGVVNWAIGCIGRRELQGMPFGHKPNLPEGIYDAHGTPVAPRSLYLAQLRERLGEQALRNIGY